MPWLATTSVPVFWPRASHWSSSESCIVFRFPEIPTFFYFSRNTEESRPWVRPGSVHRRVVGGDSRDRLADDQRVDVVGAFVGVNAFDVGEVAENRVLVDDAVGSQGLAGELRALPGDPDVVPLGHRDVVRAHRPVV